MHRRSRRRGTWRGPRGVSVSLLLAPRERRTAGVIRQIKRADVGESHWTSPVRVRILLCIGLRRGGEGCFIGRIKNSVFRHCSCGAIKCLIGIFIYK